MISLHLNIVWIARLSKQVSECIVTSVAFSVLTYIIGKKLMHIVRLRETMIRIAAGIAIALLGWIASGIHLLFFDWLFLRRGSLKTFKKIS